uniref:Gag protein n=1 Tax=Knipowitschia caucasica TaxID=637954 RepID=A0AAV2LF82_KNICA
MDPGDSMYQSVRPKRQARPPPWLQDYEVGYEPDQPIDAAPYRREPSPPLARSFDGDAAHTETPQLAPSRFRRTSREWDHQPSPVPFTSYSSPYHEQSHHMEIRAVQEENAKLLQSQQLFQSGLHELNKARTEMKELIEAARLLKTEMLNSRPLYSPVKPLRPTSSAAPVTYLPPQAEYQGDCEWPDPPPWPEPEDSYQPHDPAWPPPPPPHPYLPTKPSWNLQPAVRTPPLSQPLTRTAPPRVAEPLYRGPQPTIPKFINPDPSEFARLRIALENLLPANTTELFRYQILVDHLRLEEARLIADAYLNSSTPYTDTMAALHERFGQPHQLALRKIASVLEAPEVRRGDTAAFQKFSLQIQSLVGLLQTLGPEGDVELNCGSHVARLLGTGNRALLKIAPILVHYGGRTINSFAILDDGSERSMLLPAAAKALGMKGTPEDLPLRTVRQDIQVLSGRQTPGQKHPVPNHRRTPQSSGSRSSVPWPSQQEQFKKFTRAGKSSLKPKLVAPADKPPPPTSTSKQKRLRFCKCNKSPFLKTKGYWQLGNQSLPAVAC